MRQFRPGKMTEKVNKEVERVRETIETVKQEKAGVEVVSAEHEEPHTIRQIYFTTGQEYGCKRRHKL